MSSGREYPDQTHTLFSAVTNRARHFDRAGGSRAHTANMKVRRDLGKDLLALATHQAGVLSRDQLLRAGMSRAVIARMLCNPLV